MKSGLFDEIFIVKNIRSRTYEFEAYPHIALIAGRERISAMHDDLMRFTMSGRESLRRSRSPAPVCPVRTSCRAHAWNETCLARRHPWREASNKPAGSLLSVSFALLSLGPNFITPIFLDASGGEKLPAS